MEFQIGPWTANPATNEICNGPDVRRLEARAMDVLRVLFDRRGAVVSKDELINAVWKRHAVTDHAVTVVISDLRLALGDDSRNPIFIQTVPKRGYRLIADATANAKAPLPTPLSWMKPIWIASWSRSFAALSIALIAISVLAVIYIQSLRPAPTATLIVVDAENATNDPALNALANSLSAININLALTGTLNGDNLTVIRLRAPIHENGSAAKYVNKSGPVWRLETRIVDTGAGPVSFTELSYNTNSEIIWSGSTPVRLNRFASNQMSLVSEALKEFGANVEINPAEEHAGAAQELYWQARLFWDLRTPESAKRAHSLLLNAVEEYPSFTLGHAALADLYSHKTGAFFRSDFENPSREAEKRLEIAKTLSPKMFEVRLAEAHLALFAKGEAAAAEKILSALAHEQPSHAIAQRSYATALAATGAYDAAHGAIIKAREADPLNATTAWDAVWIYYVARQHENALQAINAAEAIVGNGDMYRGLIYADLGDEERALKMLAKAAIQRGAEGLPETISYKDVYAAYASTPLQVRSAILTAALASLAGDPESARVTLINSDAETHAWSKLWIGQAPVFADLNLTRATLAN